MNYITKTEAFAHHGATLTAPRGVWAKKSDDGKLVVLAYKPDFAHHTPRSSPPGSLAQRASRCLEEGF